MSLILFCVLHTICFCLLIQKDGISYIAKEDPDIFFVMETKCADDAIPEVTKVEGYHTYWHGAAVKKGYSGTGMFTKKEPISVQYGIGECKRLSTNRSIDQ